MAKSNADVPIFNVHWNEQVGESPVTSQGNNPNMTIQNKLKKKEEEAKNEDLTLRMSHLFKTTFLAPER